MLAGTAAVVWGQRRFAAVACSGALAATAALLGVATHVARLQPGGGRWMVMMMGTMGVAWLVLAVATLTSPLVPAHVATVGMVVVGVGAAGHVRQAEVADGLGTWVVACGGLAAGCSVPVYASLEWLWARWDRGFAVRDGRACSRLAGPRTVPAQWFGP